MDRPQTGSSSAFALALTALALPGAFVSFVLGFAGVMSSDGCGSRDARFICTETGQNVAFVFPWFGWAAAIAVSLCTAGATRRQGWGPWLGIPAGAVAYFLFMTVFWTSFAH